MSPPPDWAQWRRSAVAHLAAEPRPLARDPLSPHPLDVGPLVAALHHHGVHWVLDGSAVLLAAGLPVVPGDLDVVPGLTPANLGRLAAALADLDAFPEPVPGWVHGLSVAEASRWRASAEVANLDHRFVTAHGILDVVPQLTGGYERLLREATVTTLAGVPVRAVRLTEVLGRVRESTRPKDRERWEQATRLLPGAD